MQISVCKLMTKRYTRLPVQLGVLLDNKLNWMDHINKTAEKTNKRIELMKRLAGAMLGSTQDTPHITNNTYVKPITKYSSEGIVHPRTGHRGPEVE
jgi:phage gpG-like protein